MKSKKDIINRNSKGQYHGYHEYYYGYHEYYYYNGIGYRANYKNNNEIGYEELHYFKRTNFHIR